MVVNQVHYKICKQLKCSGIPLFREGRAARIGYGGKSEAVNVCGGALLSLIQFSEECSCTRMEKLSATLILKMRPICSWLEAISNP